MTLTWTLWRWMKRPLNGHPLYQRIVTQPPYIMPWYMGCISLVIAPFLIVPAIVFLSAVYGLRWAVQIAAGIAQEREKAMYDLLVVSPAGMIGVGRLIMSACLHRNESLEQTEAGGTWIMRGFFAVVLMLLAASVSPAIVPPDADLLGGVIVVVYLLTMGIAMYIDHLQSVVLAAEVGIIVPNYATRRLDAGAAAFLVYLVVQVTTFMLTLLLGFSIAPRLFELFHVSNVATAFALPVVRLVVFIVIREITVHYLWRRVVRETDATPSEVEFIR